MRWTFYLASSPLLCMAGIHYKYGWTLQYLSRYQDTWNELQLCLTFKLPLHAVMSHDATIISAVPEIVVPKFVVCMSPTECSPNLRHQTTVHYIPMPSLTQHAHNVSLLEQYNANQLGTFYWILGCIFVSSLLANHKRLLAPLFSSPSQYVSFAW